VFQAPHGFAGRASLLAPQGDYTVKANVVDPIFAAIEKNNTAWAAYGAAHEHREDMHKAALAADAASEPLCATAVETRWGVIDCQPTTVAGLAAKLAFMAADDGELGFGDDVFVNLQAAVTALV
jgi:hypothetical protein